jgi:Zn-dependent alcohol dehydrogenase
MINIENNLVVEDYFPTCKRCGTILTRNIDLCDECREIEEEENSKYRERYSEDTREEDER